MNIQLVVFDIAGTTVMDHGNINEAFRTAFSNAGYTAAVKDVDAVMGYRKIDAIKIILQKSGVPADKVNEHLVEIIHNDFTSEMVNFYHDDVDLKAMPFAEELFEELHKKGIKVALNTGFTRVITDTILQRLGWAGSPLIDVVICSDEVPEGRPYPFMIKSIMQQVDVNDAKLVAKVGDTKVDVEEGRNAKCGLVVAVTTGAASREELKSYQPDYVIDSLQQFAALIQ